MLNWYHRLPFTRKAIIGFILMILLFIPFWVYRGVSHPQNKIGVEPGYSLTITYEESSNRTKMEIEANVENQTEKTITSVIFLCKVVDSAGVSLSFNTNPLECDIFPGTKGEVNGSLSFAGEFVSASLESWQIGTQKNSLRESAPEVYIAFDLLTLATAFLFLLFGLLLPRLRPIIPFGLGALICLAALGYAIYATILNPIAYSLLIAYVPNFAGAGIVAHLLGNFIAIIIQSVKGGEYNENLNI